MSPDSSCPTGSRVPTDTPPPPEGAVGRKEWAGHSQQPEWLTSAISVDFMQTHSRGNTEPGAHRTSEGTRRTGLTWLHRVSKATTGAGLPASLDISPTCCRVLQSPCAHDLTGCSSFHRRRVLTQPCSRPLAWLLCIFLFPSDSVGHPHAARSVCLSRGAVCHSAEDPHGLPPPRGLGCLY